MPHVRMRQNLTSDQDFGDLFIMQINSTLIYHSLAFLTLRGSGMSRQNFIEHQDQTQNKSVLTYEALWLSFQGMMQTRSLSQNDLSKAPENPKKNDKKHLKKAFQKLNIFSKTSFDTTKVAKDRLGRLIEELYNGKNELGRKHPLDSDDYNKLLQELITARSEKQLSIFVNQLEKKFGLTTLPPLPHEINPESISTACVRENEIGKGSFATVYRKDFIRRYDITTKENAFIKSVAIKKCEEMGLVYQNECEVLDALGRRGYSKYIIQFFSRIENCLIFEFAPSKNLLDYMEENEKLNLQKELLILSGILLGLAFLREANIIHLDLKPPNIMLGYNNVPKIIDFGLSRLIPPNQKFLFTKGVGGTPYFAAPEILSGKINCAADMFSFAILACVFLNREPPYEHVSIALDRLQPYEFIKLIGDLGYRPILPEISEIDKQIEHCWNVEPSKRPSPKVLSSIFQTQSEKYAQTSTEDKKCLQKSISFPHG